jgi:hypothetical protein
MQSEKKCVYRYTLLIPGKMNMLCDYVLSMSVCHFQCQVLSSTCTAIQIYCDATSCRLVKSYRRLEGQCLHLWRDLSKTSAWTVLARLFDLEDEGTTSLFSVGTHLPVYIALTYKTSVFISTDMTASNLACMQSLFSAAYIS